MIRRLAITIALLTAAAAFTLVIMLSRVMDERLQRLEDLPVSQPPQAVVEGERSA